MRSGRIRAVATVAAAWLVAAAAWSENALGAGRSYTASVQTSGAIYVSWHGDVARGCAAAHVCSIDGVLTWRPSINGTLDFDRTTRGFDPNGSSGIGATTPATVRVRRSVMGGPPATCVEAIALGSSNLELEAGRNGSVHGRLVPGMAPLSSGRCAGPTVFDLVSVPPSMTFAPRRLLRHGIRLDLARRRAFAAGPFSGEVVSTLRVSLGRLRRGSAEHDSGATPIPSRRSTRRFANVFLRYRVEALAGVLTTHFAGLPTPACAPFDACGVSGDSQFTLASPPTELDVTGSAQLGRGRPSRTTVLAQLRRGRFDLSGDIEPPDGAVGHVTTSETRDGEPACADTSPAFVPSGSITSSKLRVEFSIGGDEFNGGPDPWRTRCGGPALWSLDSAGPLAVGESSIQSLLRRRTKVELRPAGAFGGAVYAGTYGGAVFLTLRRLATEITIGEPVP
jgi:hypothetical protein